MNLKHYQNCKYVLAEIVRGLPWKAATVLRNRQFFERLAMDCFNFAVVGRHRRGKSALLNVTDCLSMGVDQWTLLADANCTASDPRPGSEQTPSTVGGMT